MSVNKYKIEFYSNGYYSDGSPALYGSSASPELVGTPIVNYYSSATSVAFGGGVFLTASHLFDGVRPNSQGVLVDFKATSQKILGYEASGIKYLEPWNGLTAFQGIQNGTPQVDIALFHSSMAVSTSSLSPMVIFADTDAANAYLSQQKSIMASGADTASSSGTFSSIVSPGVFALNLTTAPGDSGGPAYVNNSKGVSYIVGIDSYGPANSAVLDQKSKFSYLSSTDYDSALDALPANTTFQGLAPDLIKGAHPGEHISDAFQIRLMRESDGVGGRDQGG